MNHQTGNEAKTARGKLGPWPELLALGSIQLDGAMRAGPDVTQAKSQLLATPCLQGRETKNKIS